MPIWGYFGSDQTPILPSSAQSVVLNYSCYCGVRIELAVGSLPIPRQYHLPGRVRPVWKRRQSGNPITDRRLQTSLGLEVISLRDDPSLDLRIQGPQYQNQPKVNIFSNIGYWRNKLMSPEVITITSSSGTLGSHRKIAERHEYLTELGHTIKRGQSFWYADAIAKACIVFPRPISSANKIRPRLCKA